MVSFFQCRRLFACLPQEAESVPPLLAVDGKTGSAGGVVGIDSECCITGIYATLC